MNAHRPWTEFSATYRQREIEILVQWVVKGESGSIVGLAGCGRSNLLGFFCHRPDVIESYLPSQPSRIAVVPVDLHMLPSTDLSTLYRTMLRSFYSVCDRFDLSMAGKIARLYLENKNNPDPFPSQSALQDIFYMFQDKQIHVGLVLNHFDYFCQMATTQMINTLRGLRDSFKGTLCILAGMCQQVCYLPDPARLGEMYELLDSQICWVGAMEGPDARQLIAQVIGHSCRYPTELEVDTMLQLSGHFPAILKAICHWWLNAPDLPEPARWGDVLASERSIDHRLAKMWGSLTQEEQFVLAQVAELQDLSEPCARLSAMDKLVERHRHILAQLATKGVCCRTGCEWQLVGHLFARYVKRLGPQARGRIWFDDKVHEFYQGPVPLRGITPLERNLLAFLVENPYQQHTKTDLIVNTWPEESSGNMIDNDLQQLVAGLRKKIDVTPPRYIVTWRGNPEGGYQFFPEGRPD